MTVQLSADRIQNIAEIADVSVEIVVEYLTADWDNHDDHDEWLESATDEEIANWIVACLPF